MDCTRFSFSFSQLILLVDRGPGKLLTRVRSWWALQRLKVGGFATGGRCFPPHLLPSLALPSLFALSHPLTIPFP